MRKICLFLVVLCCLSLLVNCYRDNGNYNYVGLPVFEVDTTGIELAYVISAPDTLRIPANLLYDGDKSNLSYTWSMYKLGGVAQTSVEVDTLAHTENLEVEIVEDPGSYTIEFCALDNSTGLRASFRYNLRVQGSVGSGLFVLYDKANGEVDADMVKSQIFAYSGDSIGTIDKNMYSRSNPDYPLIGEGVACGYTSMYGNYYFYIFTDSDGMRLSSDNMEITESWDDMFFSAPSVRRPQSYYTKSVMEYLINDGELYVNMLRSNVMPQFAVPKAGVEDGEISHAVAVYSSSTLAYDQKNMCFYFGTMWDGTLQKIANNGGAFDFSNIGKKMLYMDFGYNNSWTVYAVMRDEPDAGGRYIYVIDTYGQAQSTGYQALQIMDISFCPDIDMASFYAFGTLGEVAFYSVGGKVYQIDYNFSNNVLLSSDAVLDFQGEITAMKVMSNSTLLVVSVFDEQTYTSTIHVYDCDITSGALTSPEDVVSEFTIDGKVKDFVIKSY